MFSNWEWYRRLKGGVWYKHEFTGELPTTEGTYWSRNSIENKFNRILETEDYRTQQQIDIDEHRELLDAINNSLKELDNVHKQMNND